ncbi:unnamed protein product, partial [Iphiclides podalirius]
MGRSSSAGDDVTGAWGRFVVQDQRAGQVAACVPPYRSRQMRPGGKSDSLSMGTHADFMEVPFSQNSFGFG